MSRPTRAQAMADSANTKGIEANIQRQKNGKGYEIRELISTAQKKLQIAEDVVKKTEGVIDSSKVAKKVISDLLAPAQAIVSLLDAVADAHPAVKSSLLFLLGDLDPLFGEKEELHQQLQTMLDDVGSTVKDFVKAIRSAKYKGKLSGYVGKFADHKKDLNFLLTTQASLKVADIQIDVKRIVAFIDTKSAKEQKADDLVTSMGGLDVVLKDDKVLNELADKLGDKMDASTRRGVRADLEEVLKANANVFSLKLDRVSQQIQDSVETSTRTILSKLDAGPHEYIDDPDIKAVWKEMGSRTSAKTRVFLDAVHSYLHRKFLLHEVETGSPHPDHWTLHFLSKIIFYPSIGDGIDEDSSGFVSVHEVNNFINSRPSGLNWSVAQWIAFWAAGPYKTDVEHQSKIQIMGSELEKLADDVLPQNEKRVKYFCAMTKKLKLLSVYDNILDFYGESEDDDGAYDSLEELRVAWRNLEIKRIKANLETTKYRLKGIEAVAIVTDGRRIEQSLMCLIYLLLHHHLKIVRLARNQRVSVAEFEDMRETWEYLFEAFDKRLDNLLEVWRQQRLDISNQVDCYAGGLFKDWHERRQAQEELDDSDNDDSDYDYDYTSEDEDEEDTDDGYEQESADPHDRELASVISSAPGGRKKEKDSPENLLLYPVPEAMESEDEDGLSTEDESDWESPAVRKKRAETAVVERLKTIEAKLESIEGLLLRVVPNEEHPTNGDGASSSTRNHDPEDASEHDTEQSDMAPRLMPNIPPPEDIRESKRVTAQQNGDESFEMKQMKEDEVPVLEKGYDVTPYRQEDGDGLQEEDQGCCCVCF
ncbi:hypothetical protein PHLCEN_2v83 [Hermanssonia centrifuga]|uniref:Uncharacterized protein n=1 Tax=Hermanssonia centrifuga TaxID=98765 RepID=A0A2R6S772_9APHY|nr:hypothetical protein PHLCEN_2v83 [Hermanssonia centrifuga]